MGNLFSQPNTPSSQIQYDLNISQSSPFGSYLIGKNGMTVYAYTMDSKNKSVCYADCENQWPPFHLSGTNLSVMGVNNEMLKSIQRTDGTTQLTYNGWPLYYFYQDQKPGDTNGQGMKSIWYLIGPDGKLIVTLH